MTRSSFPTQLITMLSRLDNLAVLTLDCVPMSGALLQCIGSLKTLEEFIILGIYAGTSPGYRTHDSVFLLQETPFLALRRLELYYIDYTVDDVLQDALRILAGAPSLRTIVVEDSTWLNQLLPLITPQLVSFCGNLERVPLEAFLRFLKVHAALQNLTVKFSGFETEYSYLGITLDPADLPDLRSFSGPIYLAPKVISGRPVTKLASHRHKLLDREPVTFLPSIRDFYTFSSNSITTYSDPEVWRGLKAVGGGIFQLFTRVASEAALSQIGICFPNLVHLQIEVPVRRVCRYQCATWLSQPFTVLE
jgi:hypothetical protein